MKPAIKFMMDISFLFQNIKIGNSFYGRVENFKYLATIKTLFRKKLRTD